MNERRFVIDSAVATSHYVGQTGYAWGVAPPSIMLILSIPMRESGRSIGFYSRKRKLDALRDALLGNYQLEHVFELMQAVEFYDFCQTAIAQCDQRIEEALKQLQAQTDEPFQALPKARSRRNKNQNAIAFDVRAALYRLLGMDLTQIHGLGPTLL